MSSLKLARINPSTLAPVQDTRFQQKHSVAFKKYNCIRDDSGVGTAILIKTRFKFEQIFFPAIVHINLTAIKIKFRNDKEVMAISIYIPCSTPINKLNSELSLLTKYIKDHSFIMGGDLNVGSPSQANAIWQWVNRGAHILKLITPKSPTFRTGSKLDYFISSTDAFINKFCSVNDLGLEHNLIHSTINFSYRALSTPQELIYKWSKADWEAFRTAASLCQTTKIPSDCLLSNSEIDSLIEQFSNDLRFAMSEAIPKGLRSRHTHEDLPSEADYLFKERRRLRQTLKRARGKWAADADRIEHLRREISKATALINKHIKKTNSDRIDSRITNINNNVNRFRELRALSGNFAPRSCLRVKDGQGN